MKKMDKKGRLTMGEKIAIWAIIIAVIIAIASITFGVIIAKGGFQKAELEIFCPNELSHTTNWDKGSYTGWVRNTGSGSFDISFEIKFSFINNTYAYRQTVEDNGENFYYRFKEELDFSNITNNFTIKNKAYYFSNVLKFPIIMERECEYLKNEEKSVGQTEWWKLKN